MPALAPWLGAPALALALWLGAPAFALALWLGAPALALAHGPPPRALTPLASDAQGLSLVRLSGGMALRTAAGFRFLCPALWGGDEAAPAAGRDDGLVVVASSKGLFVVAGEQVRAHPASLGARGLTVASNGRELYALLQRGEQYELVRVERDRLDVLFHDPAPWHSLAADESVLQLVALREQTFAQVVLSREGAELERHEAAAASDTIAIEARSSGNVAYVLLTGQSVGGQTLGRFEGSNFRVLVSAVNGLAGPVLDGALAAPIIAVDQRLASFAGEQVTPVAEGDATTALHRFGSTTYASVKQGLKSVRAGRLEQLVYDLSEVAELDPNVVPIAQRATCETNWLHWEFDLLAAGITPRPTAMSRADGGAADAGAAEAGYVDADTLDATSDAAEREGAASDDGAESRGDGCALRPASGSGALAGGFLLVLGLLQRRRTRAQPGIAAGAA